MDILNIVLIALIFVSLIVIIAIFGKNLKKFKQAGKSAKLRKEMGESREHKKGLSFGFIFSKISEFFVWLAETVIKGAKSALQNAHSGIIEIKSKKAKNGDSKSAIVQKDLKEDKVSLESKVEKKKSPKRATILKKKIVKDKESEKKESQEIETVDFKEENLLGKEKGKKLKAFFKKDKEEISVAEKESKESEKEEEKAAKKGGFFSKINPFKKEEVVLDNKKILTEESYNEFSDGVKKLDSSTIDQDDSSINGVVRTKQVSKKEVNDDDELGVDRKILEKKILQKIAANPKDIEGYRQLGELYIKMENFDDAQSAYKFILKVSARDVDASRKLEKIKLLKRLK